ncbi:helix-turn-helix domain-containing protein [Nocardioides cavernaquae]|uniref:XRE family transcriptional regulator n=1 Tax=Nocardioides cavernaquae TaxID=2321396 RepID=A0A3A5H4W6_9ACTN|nr:XRE family transcriptional regulator [Nocardioides cavernaquae]RJS45749.1 XRE family transcriptional regulator [Nocardioides cavernaquae]
MTAAAARPESAQPESTRLGAQLKAVRLARRMTLADVAESAGITKGFLSKIERDQATASVASLMRICESLQISVGELFDAPSGDVVRRAAYPVINFGGVGMTEFLLTPRGEQRLQAILSEIEPGGGSGDEPYSLPADVEFVFVVSGRLTVTLRDEEIVLEQGDTLTFAPHAQHTFHSALDDGMTQVLWVFSPALPSRDLPSRDLPRD